VFVRIEFWACGDNPSIIKYSQVIIMVARGEIYFAELNPVQGSEQGGTRPVLIIQNDTGNTYSPTTIVLAITSQLNKARLPTHVPICHNESGLSRDSVILAEQMRTIDKGRLKKKVAVLQPQTMRKIENAMAVSIGLV
jgi:mRNA interferase MazF